MCLKLPWIFVAALTPVSMLAGSCAVGGSRASRASSHDVQLVPAGSGRYYRFETSRVVEQETDGTLRTRELGREDVGHPVASAMDLSSARACVVYEHALACVDLVDGAWTWRDPSWTTTPDSVTTAGGRAVTLSGNSALVWDLLGKSEPRHYDLSAWIRRHEMQTIDMVAPVKDRADQLIVVASRYPRVIVKRVSLGKGELSDVGGDEVTADLSNLQRCTSDGRFVYLAGAFESPVVGATARLELRQALVLIRVDLERGEHSVVANATFAEVGFRECEVIDLVAGENLVAMLLRGSGARDKVRAFRISDDGGGTSRMVFDSWYAKGAALAWVDENHFAVLIQDKIELDPPDAP